MSSRWSAFVAALLVSGSGALAQCADWITTPSQHAPFRGSGSAVASFTPPGATTPRLIVGGGRNHYRLNDLSNIAQWDGSNWTGMGTGIDNDVYDVIVWNSPGGTVLVAAGFFFNAGGVPVKSLAKWNGTSWSDVGGGVSSATQPGDPGTIWAMTVWTPPGSATAELVVAGEFAQAGSALNTKNIARWDGTTWRPLGLGIDDGRVYGLTTWDPDGAGAIAPQLVACGTFTSATNVIVNGIGRWDHVSWRTCGTGLSNTGGLVIAEDVISWDPDGLGAQNPRIAVTGHFTHAGGVATSGVASYAAGAWQTVGSGVSGDALTLWDAGAGYQQLVCGAGSTGPGTVSMPRVWNGSAWVALGSFGQSYVQDFAVWDPDGAGTLPPRLVAGGVYQNTPTGLADGVMQLVPTGGGSEWQSLGSAPEVYALTNYKGNATAGGGFEMVATSPTFQLAASRNLTTWNGAVHSSLGDVGAVGSGVRCLKSYATGGAAGGQHLVAGGSFSVAGGVAANRVAVYSDFTSNQILQDGWYAMGQGFSSTVLAVERFGGATYAGGVFTHSGATVVNRVSRFDGTNWGTLGSGANGTVFALKEYNGQLYAGGSFTSMGGLSSGGLARWNGTTWSIVGGNFNGTVYALEVWNGNLVIGGSYPGLSAPCIAAYNGSSYFNLGVGGTGSTSSPVLALGVGPDGHLYAGGQFTSIGGVPVSNLARWNGSTWSDVAGGVNGPVSAITAKRNELHVGGAFTKAKGGTTAAPGWARFTVNGVPWVATQPTGATALCSGGFASVPLTPAVGYDFSPPYSLQWRRNGVPLASGPTPWGSEMQFLLNQLWIVGAKLQDEGAYEAVITNGCGSVTTVPVQVKVCYGNCDCSTQAPTLNFADFACFLNRFASGNPDANCDLSTQAPTLNVADFTCFLARFAEGCP